MCPQYSSKDDEIEMGEKKGGDFMGGPSYGCGGQDDASFLFGI